jgi:hypothetical protein
MSSSSEIRDRKCRYIETLKLLALAKIRAKTVVGNRVAAVATALLPGTMVGIPALCAMLLSVVPHDQMFTRCKISY